nr:helix-turn-helix domain containing protein [Paraburkholderia tuberum]
MTRAESRERTRRRLLDAAASSIAEKGFAATSVEDIAAQAGYTHSVIHISLRQPPAPASRLHSMT